MPIFYLKRKSKGVLFVFILCIFTNTCLLAQGKTYLRIVSRDSSFMAQQEKLRVKDDILRTLPTHPAFEKIAYPLLLKMAKKNNVFTVQKRLFTPIKHAPPLSILEVKIGKAEGKNYFGALFKESLYAFECTPCTTQSTLSPNTLVFDFIFFYLINKPPYFMLKK